MEQYFKKDVIISKKQLEERVALIGKMIDDKYGEDQIVLVGLLKGAYVFTSDVGRAIKNPNVDVEFLVASSYKNGESTGEVKIELDLKRPLKGRRVIIIEDIADTGRTLNIIKKLFQRRGAASVEICAMCTKPARRVAEVQIDYPTFEIPDEIVVGYGLDYNEKFRHLPYVAAITEETYEKFKINK